MKRNPDLLGAHNVQFTRTASILPAQENTGKMSALQRLGFTMFLNCKWEE